MVIHADELKPETLKKLKLNKGKVPARVVVLGKLLQDIDGLTTREALWALRTASILVRGYSQDKKRNPNTTMAGRRRKTVDKRQ